MNRTLRGLIDELPPEQRHRIIQLYSELSQDVMPRVQEMIATDGQPTTLCHYTDFSGLKGILEHQKIWATYAGALNDATEHQYGINALASLAKSWDLDHDTREAALFSIHNAGKAFVTCFCDESEVLSMWKGYGARGGGFCLEFQGVALLQAYARCEPIAEPFKLIYLDNDLPGVSDQLEALHKVIEPIYRFVAKNKAEGAYVAAGWFEILATKLKAPCFREEREWRIVVRNPDPNLMHFRAGHSDVKPYIELSPVQPDSGRLPLMKVVLGPTIRKDGSVIESLKMMLERYGYPGVDVVHSEIPYRL